MKVKINRHQMIGGGNSYSAYVPVEECEPHTLNARMNLTSFTRYWEPREGEGFDEFLSFSDATMPEQIHSMEMGGEKYQAFLAHEATAEARILKAARAVFPELEQVEKWPALWTDTNLPRATKWVEV